MNTSYYFHAISCLFLHSVIWTNHLNWRSMHGCNMGFFSWGFLKKNADHKAFFYFKLPLIFFDRIFSIKSFTLNVWVTKHEVQTYWFHFDMVTEKFMSAFWFRMEWQIWTLKKLGTFYFVVLRYLEKINLKVSNLFLVKRTDN